MKMISKIVSLLAFFAPLFVLPCQQQTPINIETAGNCSEPLNIVPNCWYNFEAIEQKYLCITTERVKNDKMSIEWEQVNPPMSLLLSWKDIPYYPRTIRDIPIAHLSVRLHDSNNVIMITDKENKDFFHCDKTRDYCKSFQIEENTGTLYMSMLPLSSTLGSFGRLKINLDQPKKYIQKEQLFAIKDLWDDCCRERFKLDDSRFTNEVKFHQQHCDCVISNQNPVLENDYGWGDITTNSCEDLRNVACDSEGML